MKDMEGSSATGTSSTSFDDGQNIGMNSERGPTSPTSSATAALLAKSKLKPKPLPQAANSQGLVFSFLFVALAAVVIGVIITATRKAPYLGPLPKLTHHNFKWWHQGTIYQIYPRSFQDSNDDGVGDLKGITSRLSYFPKIGVEAIWISPMYPSPQADFGYDISNFTDVDPMFGTLDDFQELLNEAHRLGVRVLLDFVPNHTSDQHPWFKQSRSSRNNPKRDWYVWADGVKGADGKMNPPNNWISNFEGSAWEWDEHTQQYYYHEFLKDQPDLNYRNPEVLKAMQDVMVFWLDRGVDGFRVDAFAFMFEDPKLRDEPPNPKPNLPTQYEKLNHIYTTDLPECHELAHAFRSVLERYEDKFMIGEMYLPLQKLMKYFGTPEKPEFHMPFNFLLMEVFQAEGGFTAFNVSNMLDTYLNALPIDAYPNMVISNHDQPRALSRLKGDTDALRAALTLLLTLPGMPTTYYGDEIGMNDVPVSDEECLDPALNQCRDPERTPMQWTAEVPNAGFTGKHVKTWLPIANDSQYNNVETQFKDPHSILNMYTSIVKLRDVEPALHVGSYIKLDSSNLEVLAFGREYNSSSFYIFLNMYNASQTTTITGGQEFSSGTLVLDTKHRIAKGSNVSFTNLVLDAWQSLIIRVQ